MTIRVEKTVYEEPDGSDGRRILVMTLWPRGISKAKVDVWYKELGTPRDLIRRNKAGEVDRAAFVREYRKSLKGKEALIRGLAEEAEKGTITLLCVEKDPEKCHRSVLKREIEKAAKLKG